MGVLQYCFEQKKDKNNNKLTRLVRDNKRIKNTLLNKNGKIISLKDEDNINNIFTKRLKKNGSSEKKEISIIKMRKRKSTNLSAEKIHTSSKYDKLDKYSSEKKSSFRKNKFLKYKQIGEGRFGKIYSCAKISEVGQYAVKIYNKISENQKKRIKKKLDVLYTLNHQNILKAISFNQDELFEEFGGFCILFESVNYRNVDDLIKEFKIFEEFDEKLLKIYIKQILEGLKYLHENKIYHKNLKPSNILVDDEGKIKLSDCLIDSLILGNAKRIYKNLLKSETINYYIPPFFIKEMNDNNDKKTDNSDISTDDKSFKNWKSYDLWCLGCSIIEFVSRKKPWSYYKFESNLKFIEFLGSTNLIPTIPQKLSADCQELIRVLFNYSLTKEDNIYEKIFNLDFFKEKKESTNIIPNNLAESTNGNHSDDSNSFSSNNLNSESEMQLGQYLAKNKVVNALNPNENASFSVSYTMEESASLTQSLTKLKESNSSVKRNLNIKINKNNIMEKVDEAQPQNEYSPDYVKAKKENNFELLK